ncbi:MAG: Ktr system potassium uptake protein B [Flavobacteriales bacterium UBA4585]|nr:MAG: Ktr system potassium uptake protein B [Flavobacteriales bacterium UBA4585]
MSLESRLNALRERINIKLYDSREFVLRMLSRGSVLVALTTLIALVFYHGFELEARQNTVVGYVVRGSIGYYLVKYLLELLYNFHPIQFLKDRKWEGILMLFLIVDILIINLTGFELLNEAGLLLKIPGLQESFLIVLQCYVLVIVGLEFGRVGELLPKSKLSPPTLLVLSFLVLIALGTCLLMLPEMTVPGRNGLDVFTALFTSISASCVTGLSLIDISTILSGKGQFIVMLLMQLGGLNIISFAALFAILRGGFGMRQQNFMSENLGEDLKRSRSLISAIFRLTLIIEGTGAVLLGILWRNDFDSLGTTIFYSVFHSISAFNNAGFSLFSDSLASQSVQWDFSVHWVIALMIVLGGIGFGTITDVLRQSWTKQSLLRSWRGLRIGTKLGLVVSATLIVVGGIIFFFLDPGSQNVGAHISDSFFQSITARTAGFNTVSIGALATPAILFLIFLMFIGGGSGSTAGGIKTSTFALVFMSAAATIQGKKNINLYKTQIPWELMNRAFAIFLFSVVSILLGVFALTILEPSMNLLDLAFEEVSAFCTVGLSTGITADLGTGSQMILMLSMLVGRVGTLTLAFALSGQRQEVNTFKYPKANIHVG